MGADQAGETALHWAASMNDEAYRMGSGHYPTWRAGTSPRFPAGMPPQRMQEMQEVCEDYKAMNAQLFKQSEVLIQANEKMKRQVAEWEYKYGVLEGQFRQRVQEIAELKAEADHRKKAMGEYEFALWNQGR